MWLYVRLYVCVCEGVCGCMWLYVRVYVVVCEGVRGCMCVYLSQSVSSYSVSQ